MSKAGRPKADVKKEKVVSIRMKPEDYAKVKRYAESSNKTITQVMQEGVAKLLDAKRVASMRTSPIVTERRNFMASRQGRMKKVLYARQRLMFV